MSVADSDLEPGIQADQRLVDRAWLRIGAGAVIAAQAMVFSMAVNLSEVESPTVRWSIHGLLIASALAALFFLGGDLLRSAWEALRARRVSIDLLFLLTLGGALVGSLVSTVRGAGSVYYEVVAILIVIHTLGKMLGARSRLTALTAAQATRDRYNRAWVEESPGKFAERAVADVRAGDAVRVLPGEGIPIDGVILSGVSDVQETTMTGEWTPVMRRAGHPVLAGTWAVDGQLVIRADGGIRKLDTVLAQVERARLAPTRVQAQADRLTQWFLPVVCTVSTVTFFLWLRAGPWDAALFHAMAVLLVACPCAMGLATPIALWSGLAKLSRWGLIARSGDFLTGLAEADVVFLDKTGTLSGAALAAGKWRFAPGEESQGEWVLQAAASLEEGSRHPVAEAVRSTWKGPLLPVEERRWLAGEGVEGLVQGRRVAAGEASLGGGAPEGLNVKAVHVFVDRQWVASLPIGEAWRNGLEEGVASLKALGLEIKVLSGDPRAKEVLPPDWDVAPGLTPEAKGERVREAQAAGRRVLFVGDGINDAPALAAASCGIALRAGTELAKATAGATFAGDDLRFLPKAVILARKTQANIRNNLWFAASYNAVGMALAAAGWLSPVVAALLMVGSSLAVAIQASWVKNES